MEWGQGKVWGSDGVGIGEGVGEWWSWDRGGMARNGVRIGEGVGRGGVGIGEGVE